MAWGEASCRDSREWRSLLDVPTNELSLSQWRARNEAIYKKLSKEGHVDGRTVTPVAQAHLLKRLITDENAAAIDRQNAGHIRAQNENILFFAGMAEIAPKDFSIAITAGFIHDLNKSVKDPLRRDRFAPRTNRGRYIQKQTNLALSVGLNHLGERTRKVLEDTSKIKALGFDVKTALAVDNCIVHHGLGSSRFIRDLMAGTNDWWRDVYWDEVRATPKITHPEQPPLTVASLIHDLADSAQQMQGDEGWIEKYPFGYWKDLDLSLWELLGARRRKRKSRAASSLAEQIEIETTTCNQMLSEAATIGLLSTDHVMRLQVAIGVVRRTAEAWLDCSEQELEDPHGHSLCHDLARELACTPLEALNKLKTLNAKDDEADELRILMIQSSWAHQSRFRAMVAELLSKKR